MVDVLIDPLDADELTREQYCYLGWRRTEPEITSVSEAEELAMRAFMYGLALAGGLEPL